MGAEQFDPDERDWRLQAVFDEPLPDHAHALRLLHRRVRDPGVLGQLETSMPHDAVVTHDGAKLFVYAADRATIEQARAAVQAVLAQDGLDARLALAHYSEELDAWVDPDDHGAEMQARVQAADRTETRTLVAGVGREIRSEVEQTMLTWADELGLRCELIEHPHLLREQVAFNVTGPTRKVDEFARGLIAEGWATIRTEEAVMASPL
jgi:hypothetical protein